MNQFDALAVAQKQDRVVAHHVAATHGVNTDFVFLTFAHQPVPPINKSAGFTTALNRIRQPLGRAGRGIFFKL
jgi:hypothetical protein